MGFLHETTGAVMYSPCEYHQAAPGTYKHGQILTISDGKLSALTGAADTTPPFVCEVETVVSADAEANKPNIAGGDVIGVSRILPDYTYTTTLAADNAALAVGALLSVSADGLTAENAEGTFEVSSFEGLNSGDRVTGRFVTPGKVV